MTGNYLKNRLKGSGYDLKVIAERIGISPQALQSKLRTKDIKTEFLFEVAQAISESVYDLLPDDQKKRFNKAHTPNTTHVNEPELEYKNHIPHNPQDGFVRESVRNLSGNSPKTGKNQTSEKCDKCDEKERIITAQKGEIEALKKAIEKAEQNTRTSERLISQLDREITRLLRLSGKQQRDAS